MTHLLVSNFQGLYAGFRMGFYKQRTATDVPECLTHATCEEFFFIYNFAENAQLVDILPLVGKVASLVDDVASCGFEDVLFDIEKFSEENDVSFPVILENLSKNLFQVISKMNEIMEITMAYPAEDPEEFYDQNMNLGKDVGSIIRYVYNFHN